MYENLRLCRCCAVMMLLAVALEVYSVQGKVDNDFKPGPAQQNKPKPSIDTIGAPSINNTAADGNRTTAAARQAPAAGTTGLCPSSIIQVLDVHQQPEQDGQQIQQQQQRHQQPKANVNRRPPQQRRESEQSVPVWPPPVQKQGLTCTMEVSHAAFVLPGSTNACSIVRISNNLLSTLYSWQLVWGIAAMNGLMVVSADGATLVPSTDTGAGDAVRILNSADSPSIDAQGGSTTFMLQLGVAADTSAASSPGVNDSFVLPVMDSLYLNGLQCTRLPLKLPPVGDVSDCALTRWPLTGNGTFQVNSDNASSDSTDATSWRRSNMTYAAGYNSSSDAASMNNSSSMSDSSDSHDVDLGTALQWLWCMSQYCCGLQVVPSTNSADTSNNATNEAVVTAFDGSQPVDDVKMLNTSSNTTRDVINSSSSANTTQQRAVLQNAELLPRYPANSTNYTAPAEPFPVPPESPSAPAASGSSSSGSGGSNTTSLVAALVPTLSVLLAVSAIAGLLVHRQQRRSTEEQQRWQAQAGQHKELYMHQTVQPTLLRATSSSSTASSSSQPGILVSQSSGRSVASASLERQQASDLQDMLWQQKAVTSRHTAPAEYLTAAAAAAAAAEAGIVPVWRAGSWEGPTSTPYLGSHLPAAGSRLLRSASSQYPSTLPPKPPATKQPAHHTLQQAVAGVTGVASSIGTQHRPSNFFSDVEVTVQHLSSAASMDNVSRGNSAVEPGSNEAFKAMGAFTSSMDSSAIPAGVIGSSTNSFTPGSTWGSLRRLFTGMKAPVSSISLSNPSNTYVGTLSGSAVTMQTTIGNSNNFSTLQPVLPAIHAATGVQQHQQQLERQSSLQGRQLVRGWQQLQLINETAPLATAQLPPLITQQAGGAGLQAAGVLSHQQGPQSAAAAAGGSLSISRRLTPIVSILEDTSSATSNDSMTPAAWHLAEKHLLLEQQPGWLNIDFAQEVRLERKLGEGGFGQVFRARWKGEVVAAKLVPFMSLVTHHNLPVSLLSAEPTAAAGSAAAGSAAAAAGTPPGLNPGTPGAASPKRSSAADMMGVGMQFSAASLRAIKMEIRVLSQLSHDHIVAFKGACLALPHICILEELAEGGSLHARLYCRSKIKNQQGPALAKAPGTAAHLLQHVQPHTGSSAAAGESSKDAASKTKGSNRTGSGHQRSQSGVPPPLRVAEVLGIAADVAAAMCYLHDMQPQVVHRDLKPQNVLLDLKGRAKVCDFGISKMKDASLAASSTRLQAGTPAYMAPEQFEGCSVSEKVDVFAFGVLLWECCEQQQPWKDLSPMQIIYAVGLQKERLKRPGHCPDGLWKVIEACWQQQPEARPAFKDILPALKQLQEQHSSCTATAEQRQAAEAVKGNKQQGLTNSSNGDSSNNINSAIQMPRVAMPKQGSELRHDAMI